MEKMEFEIGSRYHYSGLYGGQYTVEVISRTDETVTFREYWIAEDTGRECHEDQMRSVEVETIFGTDVQAERVQIWEYHGENGYLYCMDESEMYDLIMGDGEDDSWLEELEEKNYGPSNPWDAPGMKVSDFITGVSLW